MGGSDKPAELVNQKLLRALSLLFISQVDQLAGSADANVQNLRKMRSLCALLLFKRRSLMKNKMSARSTQQRGRQRKLILAFRINRSQLRWTDSLALKRNTLG